MNLETVRIVIQILIALTILNVWLVRFGKPTSWRGDSASNMKEEFEVYGLPGWFVPLIGGAKLVLAAALVVGVWVPALVQPAAIGMAILMAGAVAMHLKVQDPPEKSFPAFSMLCLSVIIAWI